MAIVKMNKLSVIGMISEKEDLIKTLMDLGVVEISSNAGKLQDEEWAKLVEKDGDEERVSLMEKELSRVDNALGVLQKHGGLKAPLFTSRRPMTRKEFNSLSRKEKTYAKQTQELLDLNDKFNAATVDINQATAQISALEPWLTYDVPLEIVSTDELRVRLAEFPPVVDLEALSDALEEAGCTSLVNEVSRDKLMCYASIAYFKADEEKALEILKESGFTVPGIVDTKGTPAECTEKYKTMLVDLAAKKEDILSQIKERTSYKEDLEFYHDLLTIRRDEYKIRGNMMNTEKTFTFDGWFPVATLDLVRKALKKFTCVYEYSEPSEDDEIPVILNDRRFFEPMQFITGLYSLPNAREVDPTAIFTMFYIVFFGMMFADVGYGLILFAATLFAIKHYKLYEGATYQLMRVLNYCGISSAVFGVLFGSYFGDLITVVGKQFFDADIVIKPLWLNPTESSMTLLIVSCALGVLHLFVGMGIKAYEQIKAGDVLGAVNDNFVWYVIVLGLVLWLFGAKVVPWGPVAGKWMTIVGFAAAIIIPIFMNKGVGKAIGLWNIYSGVTGNLSDILSYSRLLGLGLASASIAQVVNFLASLVGHGGAGIILFILVELLGHALNFAINALGSFVHSARLQYVEFFGRFFEGGGEAFKPFGKDTKYVRIIEEGK
ncbi:MAG: V-type ATP synthase subunit I [Clostridiales bacterium]|nr:V-type ATP synthase subunit I [Candidatus Crickella caballi]